MKSSLPALAALICLSGPVFAEDAPTDADASLEALICAPYGPGYHLIAGTTTCVKVSGSVTLSVGGTVSGDGPASSGSGARSGKGSR